MQKKILICDDDRDILEVTTLVLKGQGYDVVALDSCGDIVEDAKRIRPDVILMDLRMPVHTGESGIKKLKEDPETSDIPVLIFSAVNDLSKKVQELKADGYIEKPYSIDDLIYRIRMVINITASVN